MRFILICLIGTPISYVIFCSFHIPVTSKIRTNLKDKFYWRIPVELITILEDGFHPCNPLMPPHQYMFTSDSGVYYIAKLFHMKSTVIITEARSGS